MTREANIILHLLEIRRDRVPLIRRGLYMDKGFAFNVDISPKVLLALLSIVGHSFHEDEILYQKRDYVRAMAI